MSHFPKIAIIGLGLIGGSMAKLIRQELPQTTLYAYDIASDTLDSAEKSGLIQEQLSDLDDPLLGEVDLIILATHLKQSITCLLQLAEAWPSAQIIDLGSAKQSISDVANALDAPISFIGGHPLAGKELSGFVHSDATLFYGKRFLLTPCEKTLPEFETKISAWLAQLSFKSMAVSSETHDAMMALVSHFPQAYALILGRLLTRFGTEWPESPMAFAGGGLHDHIRLMGSSEPMWTDVFQENQGALDAVLGEVVAEIEAFRAAMRSEHSAELSEWFKASSPIYEAYYQKKKEVLK